MIADLLNYGEENARPGRELCAILGIDRRTLLAMVERERRDGAPICAISYGRRAGYYLARTPEEMSAYCRRIEHRAKEVRKTAKACRETARRMAGGMQA